MTKLLNGLIISALALLFVACGGGGGGGGGGKRTGPSEQEKARLTESRSSAEAAEKAYYEKKLERIQLEQQLEDKE
ncbi:MAG: hypothetical protein FWF51_07305 [Chitinivibrionia bacterium]|nr:hypothetical protein [Chitinivibrionia bacterium]